MMKKVNYFKFGAISFMLLGIMHLLSQMSINGLDENVLQTLITMKETSFDFMGKHDLMQFYTGFSITMGFMLFAFGFQALLIKKPTRSDAILNTIISLITATLAIIYFHPLAYSFMIFSTLCFAISFFKLKKWSYYEKN